VAGALALITGSFDNSTSRSAVASHVAASSRDTVPTVPVAVLNATATSGAAGRLAQQLRSRGVKIAAVGNLTESRGSGMWIFYAPGARTQAARLAHLLAAQAPRIAPIDRAAQAAAGTATRIVAVIS
jgi:hypothetical protein